MQKLVKIQKSLKAPKGQYNSFGKYKYRNCEDILEAVKLLLEGSCLTLNDEIVMIGSRYYVKATATFTDGDFTLSVAAYARESEDKKGMDAAQITGAASSYARKYALNGLFLIDDTKDADNDKPPEESPPEKKELPKASFDQMPAEISQLFLTKGYVKPEDIRAACEACNCDWNLIKKNLENIK